MSDTSGGSWCFGMSLLAALFTIFVPAFLAAPGDAIHEGVSLINDWLSYDPAKPISATNQPRLYVSERCKNTIYALQEWTGRDGKSGSCKDPVDVLRYLVLSGATHHHDTDLSFEPLGSY